MGIYLRYVGNIDDIASLGLFRVTVLPPALLTALYFVLQSSFSAHQEATPQPSPW